VKIRTIFGLCFISNRPYWNYVARLMESGVV